MNIEIMATAPVPETQAARRDVDKDSLARMAWDKQLNVIGVLGAVGTALALWWYWRK